MQFHFPILASIAHSDSRDRRSSKRRSPSASPPRGGGSRSRARDLDEGRRARDVSPTPEEAEKLRIGESETLDREELIILSTSV